MHLVVVYPLSHTGLHSLQFFRRYARCYARRERYFLLLQHVAPCQCALRGEQEAVQANTLHGVLQLDGVLFLREALLLGMLLIVDETIAHRVHQRSAAVGSVRCS